MNFNTIVQWSNPSGSLLTRNLADLVKKEHFILDSEYLTTLLVVVPRNQVTEWVQNYEKLTAMIVPRSSQLVSQDQDFALYTVTLFKKVQDEFRHHAREKKFIVREFVYNEEELRNQVTEWVQNYEKLTAMIVPRSSQLVSQDQDFALYTVTLFKKVQDEFRHHAREKN
ncbi:V-type proton ATPase subunit C 1-like [Diaphorina citri]|uniref:V-type proton ATPase subunit C n=1 Tax=Diaphorina citri TaxID=121845 RepID=A0A3Q0JA27_DIACI|nr:V-type proton ATPase subunit C 1-like [Diaphorina citri]